MDIEDKVKCGVDDKITRRVTNLLVVVTLLLSLSHYGLLLSPHFCTLLPQQTHGLFSVWDEACLLTWFTVSVSLLLGISCLLLSLGGWHRFWMFTGVFFIALSVDDSCMLHERFGEIVWKYVQGTSVYSWVLILGPILAVLGVTIFWNMWHALNTRIERRRVFIAFACLGIALALETVAGVLQVHSVTLGGQSIVNFLQPIEEFLEFLGPLLLLRCCAGRIELWIQKRV